jgi:RNA polymerase sigma-70 factor (ECF subfamily)
MRTVVTILPFLHWHHPVKLTKELHLNVELLINSTRPQIVHRLGNLDRIAYAKRNMQDETSDEQLMLNYKEGDSAAFEVLYTRFRLPMFRYLRNQCGNEAVAEEIFQDVWLNLVRARKRYQVTASFKTYIYRLAHNRLIDYYRKQKHGVPSSYHEHENLLNTNDTANHITPQRQLNSERQVDSLLNALAELPEAQREAFLLKEETGLSVEEIAEMTNVKTETAKSRIRYAMNKLKQAVELEHHD